MSYAIHVVFANEKKHADDLDATADVSQSRSTDEYRIADLDALVRMKLISYRDKDRMHLRDMLDVGLIDSHWCDRLPPPLAD